MGKIMTIGWYPPHKAKELIKVYGSKDKPPYPDYLKKTLHLATIKEDGQWKTYALYEFPDDKYLEAMRALVKRYSLYTTVEGYRFVAEFVMDAQEAIKLSF